MRAFLQTIYTSGRVTQVLDDLLEEAAARGDWGPLERLVLLADLLEAPLLLATLDQQLQEKAADLCEPTDVDKWMPLLALTDAHRAQLPRAHGEVLRTAVRAASWSYGGIAVPIQRFCGHGLLVKLSAETLAAVLQGTAATVRASSSIPLRKLMSTKPVVIHARRDGGSFTVRCPPRIPRLMSKKKMGKRNTPISRSGSGVPAAAWETSEPRRGRCRRSLTLAASPGSFWHT